MKQNNHCEICNHSMSEDHEISEWDSDIIMKCNHYDVILGYCDCRFYKENSETKNNNDIMDLVKWHLEHVEDRLVVSGEL